MGRRPRAPSHRLLVGVASGGVALIAVVVFLALKDDPRPGRSSQPASGVVGRVLTAACHPVEQVDDPPCPPYAGEIRVLRPDESLVTTTRTDQAGRFRVELPPGRYLIDSNDGGKSLANREGLVTVREGAFTEVDLTHWVGIVCLFGQTWMHLADASPD